MSRWGSHEVKYFFTNKGFLQRASTSSAKRICFHRFWCLFKQFIKHMSSQLLMQGMLGTGRAHVSEICELARSNVQDGLPSESLVAFSSLGANGAYTSNQERDLHRWLRGLFGMELTTYKVPMKLTVAYLNLSWF